MSGSRVRGAGIAAKPAVLHIQQNEPLTQKQQREAMLELQHLSWMDAGFTAIDSQSGYAGIAAIHML